VIGNLIDLQIDAVFRPVFVAASTKLDEVILAADHTRRQHTPSVMVNIVGGCIGNAVAEWSKQIKSD
jgi:hypothetical protein